MDKMLACLLLLNNIILSSLPNKSEENSVNDRIIFQLLNLYLYICRENSRDLLTIIGAMYVSVLFIGINNSSSVLPVIDVERTVFYRERAAGMYSALPYAMAQVRTEENQIITFPLICTTFTDLIKSKLI